MQKIRKKYWTVKAVGPEQTNERTYVREWIYRFLSESKDIRGTKKNSEKAGFKIFKKRRDLWRGINRETNNNNYLLHHDGRLTFQQQNQPVAQLSPRSCPFFSYKWRWPSSDRASDLTKGKIRIKCFYSSKMEMNSRFLVGAIIDPFNEPKYQVVW